MRQHPLDDRTVNRLLAGAVTSEDAPAGLAGVAALLSAARPQPAPAELANEAATVAAMRSVITTQPVSITTSRRKSVLAKVLSVKAAVAAAALLLSATGAAAATGSLPGAAQQTASDALAKVGISVPAPNSHAGDHPAPGQVGRPRHTTGRGHTSADDANTTHGPNAHADFGQCTAQAASAGHPNANSPVASATDCANVAHPGNSSGDDANKPADAGSQGSDHKPSTTPAGPPTSTPGSDHAHVTTPQPGLGLRRGGDHRHRHRDAARRGRELDWQRRQFERLGQLGAATATRSRRLGAPRGRGETPLPLRRRAPIPWGPRVERPRRCRDQRGPRGSRSPGRSLAPASDPPGGPGRLMPIGWVSIRPPPTRHWGRRPGAGPPAARGRRGRGVPSVRVAGRPDIGAFSAQGPWVVEPDNLAWRRGLDRVRAATAASVPELTRRRRLPPGARVVKVGALLGRALGGWYLTDRRKGEHVSRAGLSRRLRQAFERLGPTYIKLGQIISSGEGIFPEELVTEFRLLRDQVPAESFDAVRAVVEADLGKPLEQVFKTFDRTPVAAASIAQVHAATLHTGESVVVKVQRPQVASLVRTRPGRHELDRAGARGPHPRFSRWPTRPRWSSCSPRPSSRSSTSASRPRTCSTSPGSSPRPASGPRRAPPPP